MKAFISAVAVAFALVSAARADDVTVKISDVHMCCGKCVKIAEKTVAGVPGATAQIDKDAGTVSITAPDKATAQKAADALVAAGYFGTSGDVKLDPASGAKDAKVQSLEVTGVHLCCDSCVKAVDKAVKSVPGVTGETAVKGAKSFTVTGDFNDAAVFVALQKAGLTGKAGN